MAVYQKDEVPPKRPLIDLNGPDGNAFVLMSFAHQWSKQLGYNKDETRALIDDMKSSDYVHLVRVFHDRFGQYIDLVLPHGWTDELAPEGLGLSNPTLKVDDEEKELLKSLGMKR